MLLRSGKSRKKKKKTRECFFYFNGLPIFFHAWPEIPLRNGKIQRATLYLFAVKTVGQRVRNQDMQGNYTPRRKRKKIKYKKCDCYCTEQLEQWYAVRFNERKRKTRVFLAFSGVAHFLGYSTFSYSLGCLRLSAYLCVQYRVSFPPCGSESFTRAR